MRGSWLKRMTGRTILLHLKDSDSIEGILIDEYEDGILLRRARMLKTGAPPSEMGDEVWVPRAQLILAQHGVSGR